MRVATNLLMLIVFTCAVQAAEEIVHQAERRVRFERALGPTSEAGEKPLALGVKFFSQVPQAEKDSEHLPTNSATKSPEETAQITLQQKLLPAVSQKAEISLSGANLQEKTEATFNSALEDLLKGLQDPILEKYRTTPALERTKELKNQATKKLMLLRPLFNEIYEKLEATANISSKTIQSSQRELLKAFYAIEVDTTVGDTAQLALEKVKTEKLAPEAVCSAYQSLLTSLYDPDILAYKETKYYLPDVRAQAKRKLDTLKAEFLQLDAQLEDTNSAVKLLKENLNRLAQEFYGSDIAMLKEELSTIDPVTSVELQKEIEVVRDMLTKAQELAKKASYIKKELLPVVSQFSTVIGKLEHITTPRQQVSVLVVLKSVLKRVETAQSILQKKIMATKQALPNMNTDAMRNLFKVDLEALQQINSASSQLATALGAQILNSPELQETQASTLNSVKERILSTNKQLKEINDQLTATSPRAAGS